MEIVAEVEIRPRHVQWTKRTIKNQEVPACLWSKADTRYLRAKSGSSIAGHNLVLLSTKKGCSSAQAAFSAAIPISAERTLIVSIAAMLDISTNVSLLCYLHRYGLHGANDPKRLTGVSQTYGYLQSMNGRPLRPMFRCMYNLTTCL